MDQLARKSFLNLSYLEDMELESGDQVKREEPWMGARL